MSSDSHDSTEPVALPPDDIVEVYDTLTPDDLELLSEQGGVDYGKGLAA